MSLFSPVGTGASGAAGASPRGGSLQPPRSSFRRDLGLVAWQIRYEQRSYWRNRGRGLFTFAFPIMFLVIFASLDKGAKLRDGVSYEQFFVPGILAYGVISTTFTNLSISTAILRDEGILKRMQGTPLPRWAYVAARIGSTFLVALAMTVVVLVLGAVVWGVRLRAGAVPGLVVTLLLGSAAFTALGIGITRFMPTAESSPVIVNLAVLPLTFISNVWFPTDRLPATLRDIAGVFPIKALASGLQHAFDPRLHDPGFDGAALQVLAIWTVVGVWLMIRFLRQPQGEAGA